MDEYILEDLESIYSFIRPFHSNFIQYERMSTSVLAATDQQTKGTSSAIEICRRPPNQHTDETHKRILHMCIYTCIFIYTKQS